MPAVIRHAGTKPLPFFRARQNRRCVCRMCMRRRVPCPMWCWRQHPEIVLIVDSAFQIIEFNKRAEDVFGINKSEAVNKMIFEIMDASDFEQVLEDHLSIKRKKIHLSGLGLVLLENIIYIEEMDAMLAIFQDVTDEEAEMERQHQMRMDTVDIAQQVMISR